MRAEEGNGLPGFALAAAVLAEQATSPLQNPAPDVEVIDVDAPPSRADVHPFFRKTSDGSELTDLEERPKTDKQGKTKPTKAKSEKADVAELSRQEQEQLLALE